MFIYCTWVLIIKHLGCVWVFFLFIFFGGGVVWEWGCKHLWNKKHFLFTFRLFEVCGVFFFTSIASWATSGIHCWWTRETSPFINSRVLLWISWPGLPWFYKMEWSTLNEQLYIYMFKRVLIGIEWTFNRTWIYSVYHPKKAWEKVKYYHTLLTNYTLFFHLFTPQAHIKNHCFLWMHTIRCKVSVKEYFYNIHVT